jgi:hypothetical protein
MTPTSAESRDATDVQSVPKENRTSQSEEKPTYPEGLAVALIMGASWLVIFLVAIVRLPHRKNVLRSGFILTILVGSNHFSSSRTQNNR